MPYNVNASFLVFYLSEQSESKMMPIEGELFCIILCFALHFHKLHFSVATHF